MSLEDAQKKREKLDRRNFIKGWAIGAGTAIAGGAVGMVAASKEHIDEINSHLLTPAAMDELMQQTGAAREDILGAERRIKDIVRNEIERIIRERRGFGRRG